MRTPSRAHAGRDPSGFRAPGYTVTDALFSALDVAGVEYDSSVFPCPSYYAAKVAALAAMRLRGRASASIVDTPAVLQAPREPYRIGRPYWRRGDGLLELPVGVTPLQLPYIGTSLILGGERTAERLTKQMLGRELINLELHGLDAADAEEDGLAALDRTPRRPPPERRRQDALAERGCPGHSRSRLRARHPHRSGPALQDATQPVDSLLWTARTASSSACSLSRTP